MATTTSACQQNTKTCHTTFSTHLSTRTHKTRKLCSSIPHTHNSQDTNTSRSGHASFALILMRLFRYMLHVSSFDSLHHSCVRTPTSVCQASCTADSTFELLQGVEDRHIKVTCIVTFLKSSHQKCTPPGKSLSVTCHHLCYQTTLSVVQVSMQLPSTIPMATRHTL